MTTATPEPHRADGRSRARRMAAGLFAIGTLHFAVPKPFDAIIPEELPGPPRFYTYASGVAELGVAALLLSAKTRRLGALAAVALFISVFPANINMVRLWFRDPNKSTLMRATAIARLPLQLPMILEARRIYRGV